MIIINSIGISDLFGIVWFVWFVFFCVAVFNNRPSLLSERQCLESCGSLSIHIHSNMSKKKKENTIFPLSSSQCDEMVCFRNVLWLLLELKCGFVAHMKNRRLARSRLKFFRIHWLESLVYYHSDFIITTEIRWTHQWNLPLNSIWNIYLRYYKIRCIKVYKLMIAMQNSCDHFTGSNPLGVRFWSRHLSKHVFEQITQFTRWKILCL